MYINRQIESDIKKNLFKGDILVLYGARQVGKTTLVKKILGDFKDKTTKYLNLDEGDVFQKFSEAQTSHALKQIIGDTKLVVLDEAQRVHNIGLKLKLLADNFPKQQVIATGSSSFDLSGEIKEPLTGRSREFWLYPLTFFEMFPQKDNFDFERNLENLLIYGSYPRVFEAKSLEQKEIEIQKITQNYLYKDVLKFQNLKSAEIVRKLLAALALQIGNEVSYNELSSLVGVSKQTVESYVEILEKAFVIFRVGPYSTNLRKAIGKLRKIYFYDLGVRNALIDSIKPLSIRSDVGALWENFVVGEFVKKEPFVLEKRPVYFWRTYDGAEVDLVREQAGKLRGYEIKWGKSRKKAPKAWSDTYKNSSWQVVTRENFLNIV